MNRIIEAGAIICFLVGLLLLAFFGSEVKAQGCTSMADFLSAAAYYDDYELIATVPYDGQFSDGIVVYRANNNFWFAGFKGDCYLAGPFGLELAAPAPTDRPAVDGTPA